MLDRLLVHLRLPGLLVHGLLAGLLVHRRLLVHGLLAWLLVHGRLLVHGLLTRLLVHGLLVHGLLAGGLTLSLLGLDHLQAHSIFKLIIIRILEMNENEDSGEQSLRRTTTLGGETQSMLMATDNRRQT